MRSPLCCTLALRLTCVSLSTYAAIGQAAESAKLAVAEAAPPEELAEPIRAVLQPTVVRLAERDKPFLEFWFRKEIPLVEKPSGSGFPASAVKEGTLLGAVQVRERRYDFKDLAIPPGVYVLRFCLEPQDGNHQGTSPTRTFALLVPAKQDQQLSTFPSRDALVKGSSTINAGDHPSTLNLQSAKEPGESFPRLASHNGGKHKVVYLRLPAKVDGQSEPVMLTFALVYEGKGQI